MGSLAESPSGDSLENIEIRNITIDGNKDNQGSGDGSEYYKVPYTYLRVNGITIRRCKNVIIENVTVTSARSGGIVTEKGVHNLKLLSSTVRSSWFDAIAIYETSSSFVQNCLFEKNNAAGISIDWNCTNNTFSNNIIRSNGYGSSGTSKNPGMYIAHAYNNLFSNNIIVQNAGNGIILTHQEIVPNSGASNNSFDGNIISNNGEFGIWISQSTCIGNAGHGNYYMSNSSGTILESVADQYQEIDPIIK